MLYFGMIPIVKTSSLDPLYKDLPVLILQEWDDLCNLDLEKVYEEMNRKMPVSEDVIRLKKAGSLFYPFYGLQNNAPTVEDCIIASQERSKWTKA